MRIFMLYYFSFGALAQLGARHAGSVEVTGSSPVCSIGKSTVFAVLFLIVLHFVLLRYNSYKKGKLY